MQKIPVKKASILLFCSLLLIGCSDPKSYQVTTLTEEQKKELGQKLTADEGQKLMLWQIRQSLTGKKGGEGVTVEQAIKEQDEWLEKRKGEELKAAEIKKRVEEERKAKQEEFGKLLSVALINKKNTVQEYNQKFVNFELAFENKSDKDIQGVKGILRITDIFDDTIQNIRWSFDNGVKSKQTFVERGAGLDINQFKDEHMKLWNTDFEKLKSTFEVQTIIFADGTKIDAPE